MLNNVGYKDNRLNQAVAEASEKIAFHEKAYGEARVLAGSGVIGRQTEAPLSEVHSAFGELDEELKMAENTRQILHERLFPVLALDRPEANSSSKTEVAGRYGASGIGKAVIETTQRVRRMRLAMQETIDLLAI